MVARTPGVPQGQASIDVQHHIKQSTHTMRLACGVPGSGAAARTQQQQAWRCLRVAAPATLQRRAGSRCHAAAPGAATVLHSTGGDSEHGAGDAVQGTDQQRQPQQPKPQRRPQPPPEPEQQPPTGPNLPPQLRQLLALLTEFGGKYGTAAVLVAWLTHIDPFGGLHWDAGAVTFGLVTFLPLMLFDAALMLPDYSIEDPEQQRAVTGMFLGTAPLLQAGGGSSKDGGNGGGRDGGASSNTPADSAATSSSSEAGVSEETLAAAAAAAAAAGAPVAIVQLSPQEQSQPASAGGAGSSAAVGPLLRLRVALGLLQQVYTRANPGIGLSPLSELAVVLVATLADEMLYRAVGLTLLGLWLRDRLFEAGFDDDVSLSVFSPWLGWLSQQQAGVVPDVAAADGAAAAAAAAVAPISVVSQYLAVGVIALLGIAGFAAGAYREVAALQRMQVLDREGRPAAGADAAGRSTTSDDSSSSRSSAAASAALLKSRLVESLGSQNILLYGVEGLREVTASVMAGVAFVATGNLAAPLAGSVVVQTLFSLYQRVSLERVQTKRRALADKMRARNKKLQAAMAAALAAKQAEAATAAAAAAEAPGAAGDAAAGAAQQARGDRAAATAEPAAAQEVQQQHQQQQEGAEEVDFLTAVLQAAERQQQQAQQQEQQQAQAKAQQAARLSSSATSADGSVASSGGASGGSSSGVAASSSHGAAAAVDPAAAAAAADAAQRQLSVLLEDMLRSPEGSRIVQQWMAKGGSTEVLPGSSADGSSSASSVKETVDRLLSDPAIKAQLLQELQGQLLAMSQQGARPGGAGIEASWRSKL